MTDTWDGITANLLNKSEKLAYVVMLHDSQHFFLKWVTVRIDTSASGRSRSTLPGSQPQKSQPPALLNSQQVERIGVDDQS